VGVMGVRHTLTLFGHRRRAGGRTGLGAQGPVEPGSSGCSSGIPAADDAP
jgi:hypothetical protein